MSADRVSNSPLPVISQQSLSQSSHSLKQPDTYKQWWMFGPIVLALIMFLLMGTIFEKKIEALWRHLLERRQAVLNQQTEGQDTTVISTTAASDKTPSQRTLGDQKDGTTTTANKNHENKLESKSLTFPFTKKDYLQE